MYNTGKLIVFAMLLAPIFLFGQETFWLKKNLGNGEEVFQFRLKDKLDLEQLKTQFPIRLEIEWSFILDNHAEGLSSSELKKIGQFEELFLKELAERKLGIFIGGFDSTKRKRWICYVKEEAASYKLLTELKQKLPNGKMLEVFEEEDINWKEYRQLKELILGV